jgi:hypothetical protein
MPNKKFKPMKNLILLLSSFLIILSSSFATELNYKWKANSFYAFNSIVTDNISTSVMGMNVSDKYITTVDFVLFIQSVDANGLATGRLYLTNFNVRDSKGLIVASLANIPKDAVKSDITVDKKGNFTFTKKVTLVTTPTSNVLVYANATENNAQAGIQTEGEKVDAYAEFDPKTGKLKAGYTLQTIQTTKKVTVNENEQSDELDVLPYDFLQMLVMPEGEIAVNNHYNVKAGMYTVDILVNSMANGIATIGETIATDKSADMFEGSASGETEDGSFNVGSFGGTNQMDLTEEDQEAIEISKSMSPNMDGTLTATFDYTNGMFVGVSGTINTNIETMGMKMTVKSVLTMKKM